MRVPKLLSGHLALTISAIVPFAIALTLLGHGAPAAAQEIIKWTDENGRVHYGDKRDAPKTGEKVTLHNNNGSGSGANTAQPSGFADLAPKTASVPSGNRARPGEKTKLPPLNVNLPADVSKENLAQCSQLAMSHARRDMQGIKNKKNFNGSSSSEAKSEFEKIKSLCNNVGFYCELHPNNPLTDRCDPFAYPGSGPLLSSEWRN